MRVQPQSVQRWHQISTPDTANGQCNELNVEARIDASHPNKNVFRPLEILSLPLRRPNGRWGERTSRGSLILSAPFSGLASADRCGPRSIWRRLRTSVPCVRLRCFDHDGRDLRAERCFEFFGGGFGVLVGFIEDCGTENDDVVYATSLASTSAMPTASRCRTTRRPLER